MTRELKVASIHPGVRHDTIAASTGWQVEFEERCGDTEKPRIDELARLRELKAQTAASRGIRAEL